MSTRLRATQSRPAPPSAQGAARQAPGRILAALAGIALMMFFWDSPAEAEGSRPSLLGTVDGILGTVEDTVDETLGVVEDAVGEIAPTRPAPATPAPSAPTPPPASAPAVPPPPAPPPLAPSRTQPTPSDEPASASTPPPPTFNQVEKQVLTPAVNEIEVLNSLNSPRPKVAEHLDQLTEPLLAPLTPVTTPVVERWGAAADEVGRLVGGLSPVTDPLTAPLRPVADLTGSVIEGFTPVIDSLDPVVDRLTPVVAVLAPVTGGLAPIVDAVVPPAPWPPPWLPPPSPDPPDPPPDGQPEPPPSRPGLPAEDDRSGKGPGSAGTADSPAGQLAPPAQSPPTGPSTGRSNVVLGTVDPSTSTKTPLQIASSVPHQGGSPLPPGSIPASAPATASAPASSGSTSSGGDKHDRTFEGVVGAAPTSPRSTAVGALGVTCPDPIDGPGSRPGFAPD